jgi:hypothetical protein
MSTLDVVAWIFLVVVALAAVVIALALAALPGEIARKRNHPWAQAVRVAGWVSFFLGFALWPIALVWAYVDAPTGTQRAP